MLFSLLRFGGIINRALNYENYMNATNRGGGSIRWFINVKTTQRDIQGLLVKLVTSLLGFYIQMMDLLFFYHCKKWKLCGPRKGEVLWGRLDGC